MIRIIDLKTEDLEMAAVMLKAIAHPMRIAILNLLYDGSRLTVSQIYQQLNIDQATASHHLGILKDKGLLASKREGKTTLYYITNKNLPHLLECLTNCKSSS